MIAAQIQAGMCAKGMSHYNSDAAIVFADHLICSAGFTVEQPEATESVNDGAGH